MQRRRNLVRVASRLEGLVIEHLRRDHGAENRDNNEAGDELDQRVAACATPRPGECAHGHDMQRRALLAATTRGTTSGIGGYRNYRWGCGVCRGRVDELARRGHRGTNL